MVVPSMYNSKLNCLGNNINQKAFEIFIEDAIKEK